MMKLRVLFARGPLVEVECEPREAALILRELAAEWGDGLDGQGPRPSPSRAGPLSAGPIASSAAGGRGYRGRVNRRDLVLKAFRELRGEENHRPSLSEIKARFQSLFPTESLDNLDQVVRDLANKTDMVERCERGTFRLREAKGEAGSPR